MFFLSLLGMPNLMLGAGIGAISRPGFGWPTIHELGWFADTRSSKGCKMDGFPVLGQLQLERIQLPATHVAHDQR